ncbi:MAG: response regulator transcription factor [Herbaspirillum sp.]
MHISIFSSSSTDLTLIARSLPAYDCHGMQHLAEVRCAHPQLLIVDIASAGAQLAEIVKIAQAAVIPLLLLTSDATHELAVLSAYADDRLIESEFKPLRRHAIAARVKLLLQRVYPEHDERKIQQFGNHVFESPAHIVTHAGKNTLLTQKEFALAILLFSNLGRSLSRAYLQESIWGLEDRDRLPTRTIDTHVSRVRNKLNLRPENGFRLGTIYGYGYQLEKLTGSAD